MYGHILIYDNFLVQYKILNVWKPRNLTQAFCGSNDDSETSLGGVPNDFIPQHRSRIKKNYVIVKYRDDILNEDDFMICPSPFNVADFAKLLELRYDKRIEKRLPFFANKFIRVKKKRSLRMTS